jgi:hypothetical protein
MYDSLHVNGRCVLALRHYHLWCTVAWCDHLQNERLLIPLQLTQQKQRKGC